MEPKYIGIFKRYRQKILEQNNLKEWKLPSESELMKEFKVSRQTVRKAVSELAKRGLVESRQGSGVFAIKPNNRRLKIAFITFTLDTYIFPEIIRGISEELFLKNSDLLLFHTDYDLEKERTILTGLDNIDGIIITPCYTEEGSTNKRLLEKINENGIPVVLLDNYFPDNTFTTVSIDDYKGGILAAEKLYTSGHRKIAIIYGKEHFGMIRRMEGASSYLNKRGLTTKKGLFTFKCSLISPYRETEEIFNTLLSNKITGIFCTNDQIALEIIKEAKKQDIILTDNISIIGFDNHKGNAHKITTLSHPKKFSGELAAQIIVSMIKNGIAGTKTISLIEPKIIAPSPAG